MNICISSYSEYCSNKGTNMQDDLARELLKQVQHDVLYEKITNHF